MLLKISPFKNHSAQQDNCTLGGNNQRQTYHKPFVLGFMTDNVHSNVHCRRASENCCDKQCFFRDPPFVPLSAGLVRHRYDTGSKTYHSKIYYVIFQSISFPFLSNIILRLSLEHFRIDAVRLSDKLVVGSVFLDSSLGENRDMLAEFT